jgi:GNAT superfamily N-acetyltransferase
MTEVAARVEVHEADMWARMVAATANVEGDPLGARVDRTGSVPLFALTALNFPLFNRVVSLGVAGAADAPELDRVLAWFAGHGQSRFWVEVTPVARPSNLRELLAARGLVDSGFRQAKTWRRPADVPIDPSVRIEELTVADRDGFAAVNVAAWEVPPLLTSWFGATVGVEGFRHFGVRDDDGRVVSTGTLFVRDGVAWLGYGATYPEFRGRGYQTALLAHRVSEAARMGCEIAHSETRQDAATPDDPNPSLHNMLRTGFEVLYDKEVWAPAPTPGG